ncbi:hypothetical protein F5Y07DRAFT_403127 [Xylaria sp. FL0933]|nr:hypothetical protein F5Y07DRAFT_403127 [Xylaria sp. FL0933]
MDSLWSHSDCDSLQCRISSRELLNNRANLDSCLECRENSGPQGPLQALQRPLPCFSDPEDEWIVEFKRLQDVRSRALSSVSVSSCQNDVFTVAGTAAGNIIHTRASCAEIRKSSPSPSLTWDTSPKVVEAAYVEDETDCPTPTPGCPGAMIYTTMLYDWNPAPLHHNCQSSDIEPNPSAMKELREMERCLQEDTKRRMVQIEQSHKERIVQRKEIFCCTRRLMPD